MADLASNLMAYLASDTSPQVKKLKFELRSSAESKGETTSGETI
jgi:hypothetical protein